MEKPSIQIDDKGQLSSANLELLLDGLNDFIFICDKDWKLVYSNKMVSQVTGYSPDEIIGKSLTDFQEGFQTSAIKDIASKLLQDDKMTAELPFLTKSGQPRKLLVSIKKITWNGEKALLFITNDVTRFEVMKDQLKYFQAREEALLDNIPYQAWFKDKDGVFIIANQVFARVFGMDKKDIKGKTDFDICEKERARQYLEQDREVMEKGERLFEARELENGNFKWYHTIKSAITNEDGEVIGTTGITQDITATKRNQRQQELVTNMAYQLNQTKEFSKRIDESLQLIGEHTNASRVYIFENNDKSLTTSNTYEWCNTGIASQIDELDPLPYEMVPNWWRYLNEHGMIQSSNIEDLPEDMRAILEPQQIKALLVYPIFINDKQIGFIGFDECIHPRQWTYDEVQLLKTVSHMISNAFQRQNYEEALRRSERKFRELVELLPEMVTETDEKGFITFANELSLRKFKYDREKIEQGVLHIFDLIADNDKPRAIEVLEKVIRGDRMENNDFEYQAITRDGKTFPVLVFVNASVENGRFQGLRGVMVDISDRKADELKLLEAKQKAEEASIAKEQFLATMSHEIRTPLNAIIGTVNLLKDDQGVGSQDLTETLELSSRQLLNLINDILDFSKIEAGKLTIQPSEFNLESLLDNVMKLFQQKAIEKGIALNVDLNPYIPKYILGDGSRLMQVLNNLVGNAIKFTEKGSVTVAVYPEKEEDDKHIWLKFEVKDTGIGIPREKHEHIFDSFSQVESSRTRKFEGTGLGLAITRKLVKLMGGEIKLKSILEEGSTFYFTLPFEKREKKTIRQKQTTFNQIDDNLEGVNILLVEDNLINQKIAAKFLKRWKADVDMAENGKEALQELNQRDYDVILMDIQMPVMDGYEATKKVRSLDNENKDIPIIALTASALLEVESEVRGAGMNDYITKPFDPADLFDKINRSIQKKNNKQKVNG